MLKRTLIANALSCFGFGLLFLLNPQLASETLGRFPIVVLQVLGAGLITNSVLLMLEARRAHPRRQNTVVFAIGDFIWVIATVGLIATQIWITNPIGILWAVLTSLYVAGCGFLQLKYAPDAGGPETSSG